MAEERPGASFPGGNWVVLAVAAISALYVTLQARPLDNLRPPMPPSKIHTAALQDVEARLWQDPLAAAVSHAKSGDHEDSGARHTVEGFKASLSKPRLGDPADKPTEGPLVLAVTVPGGGYAEDVETRRRLRYAVVAALSTERYVPEDEKHIGYIDLETNKKREEVLHTVGGTDLVMRAGGHTAGDQASDEVPDLIPFEWFKSEAQRPIAQRPIAQRPEAQPPIVVLWLNENALIAGGYPLGALKQIACKLDLGKLAQPNLRIVGPTSSTTLERMIREAHDSAFTPWAQQTCNNTHPPVPLPTVQIYNFGATVAESQLAELGGTEALSKVGQYLRVTSADDQLASILVEELGRRGLSLVPTIKRAHDGQRFVRHRDHIVIVSEADTVYGQYLPRAVESAFQLQTGMTSADIATDVWIHRFQYLRGLDGQMPGSSLSDVPASPRSRGGNPVQTAGPSSGAENRERAEGQSQYDYLRRLIGRIEHLDSDLHRKGAKIAAIGIFGSDVYDKLTILQALRRDFSEATSEAMFFTTDLDALLLPQEKLRYTRNLIVASGFGLQLRDEVQAGIPPFRDTYQSAAFVAARLAVENPKLAFDRRPPPRLFEIGRTDARPLPISISDTRPPRANCAKLSECSYIHPAVGALYPPLSPAARAGIAVVGAAAILAMILALPLGRDFCFAARRWRENANAGRTPPGRRPPHGGWRWATVALLSGLPPIAVGLFWPAIGHWLTSDGLGEPVTFFEGTSLWTPTALRVISALIAVYLIILTFRLIRTNLQETNRDLGAIHELEKADAVRIGMRPLRWLQAVWTLQPMLAPPRDPNHPERRPRQRIETLIEKFHTPGRSGARVLRAGVATVLMMALWWMLCLMLGFPANPARGSLAPQVYACVTVIDVFATLFLMFVVIDAALFSRAFIRVLTAIRSDWPPQTVRLFTHTLKLPEPYLDDWIDMEFMARRTEQIMKLCYFPFIMLALLLITRNSIFANMPQHLPSLITAAIGALLIGGSVYALRRSAETAREIARQKLTTKLIAEKGSNEKRAAQVEVLLAGIDNLRVGAFAPWSSQPIVKAFILPLLTYGGTMLLQIYALPGG